MKKKHLLALAMLSSIGLGSVSAADQHYLIKDGKLQEGVSPLEATEAAPDHFTSGAKAPDGSECVTLTHKEKYTEAKLYIEEGVDLSFTHSIIIDYCFEALEGGNYTGKYPVLQYGFAPDTTGDKYTKDACSGWGAFDVKFKHYGKENQWVSDTALVYVRPDELGKGHKLLLLAFNRENATISEEIANVLYIKNIRLVANTETNGENLPRPFFAENFDPKGLAQTSGSPASERYLVVDGEKKLATKAGKAFGYANKVLTSGYALSVVDPDGIVASIDDWGEEVYNTDFNANFQRLWETFGSELNSGALVEGAENPTPDFSKPFDITPGAYYDTELFHSLLISKSLAKTNVHYGFTDINIDGDIVGNETELVVSFLAKTTAAIEDANTEIPVFVKFDNSDEIKVTNSDLAPAWTKYSSKIAIPAGAKSMSILFRPNSAYSYNVDNLTVAGVKNSYVATSTEGSGIDNKDIIIVNFDANVGSIEANADVNATAYFDGDNFIVKADEEIASISIIDMAGKTASVNGGEFNVSGFNKGIYVFVAKTVNGVSISGKIIIE